MNYIENYLKYSDNLENLFDSIYKINGKITLETTNEEKFIILSGPHRPRYLKSSE